MHEEPDKDSSYESQVIYGQQVFIISEEDDGWALVESPENYKGYLLKEGLVFDDPSYRASPDLCKVASIGGIVYPIADTEKPKICKLPYGALVEVIDPFEGNSERWLQVRLLDGTIGWMQRGDLEKPHIKSLEEILSLATQFLELPYVWGGSSSEGYDCSGFMQTLFRQAGYIFPRNSRPQAEASHCEKIDRSEIKPGDLIFFGRSRVFHVGLHIGEENFIHSGTKDHRPKININNLATTDYPFKQACRLKEITFESSISPITEEIRSKMQSSWNEGNPVPLEDLRYVTLNHWGFDYTVHQGELIVHKQVAEELVTIFAELFECKYPIEKMRLVDVYNAEDTLSCEDNNSSAFCSRRAVGKDEWSDHSYGLAIDINPLLNPYQRGDLIIPINGKKFLDRTADYRGLITEGDPCYKAFTKRGWLWGGHWENDRGYVDFQHFYKPFSL